MKIYEVTAVTDEIVNAFRKLIPQLSADSPVPNKSDLEIIINSKNTIIFIAEEDSILGSLTLVFNKTPTGNKVWIEDVVVDINARGKGVGEKLISFAIDFVSNKGINKIDLTSMPGKIAANKLYQKLGFERRETNVYRLIIKDKNCTE